MTDEKSMYWLISGLVLVFINLLAVPCALLTFTTIPAGTSISLIDYLIALTFLLIPNIVTISLFVSVKKENVTEFLISLALAVVEVTVIASLFFGILDFRLSVILIGLCTIGGIILIVKPNFLPSTKLAN